MPAIAIMNLYFEALEALFAIRWHVCVCVLAVVIVLHASAHFSLKVSFLMHYYHLYEWEKAPTEQT